MKNPGHETDIPGSRQSDLKKSFKTAVRSLLTACSKQGLGFSNLSLTMFRLMALILFCQLETAKLPTPVKFGAEQNMLYRLYTQVIVNLHQTLEDEFDAQCQEFQVGPILDKVEQLVEEQSLDPLFSDKTNVMDIANDITTTKKREIQKLTGLLQRAEEQNRQTEARISLLRKQPQEVSVTANAIEKLKTGISGQFQGYDKLPPI